MFESDTDFEFDALLDDIQLDNVVNLKRTIGNESGSPTNKKICLDNSLNIFSAKAELRCESTTNSPNRKVVLRKFPGPAGLLPERQDSNVSLKTSSGFESDLKLDADLDVCSQMTARAFHSGPWNKMCNDLCLSGSLHNIFLPDKYNIAWINDKIRSNKLINKKAPFLAAVVQKIECSKTKTAVVSMLLRDKTGEMHATISYDLYVENLKDLKLDSVIVLKQFGVLTTEHGGNHYITITDSNLVAIYSIEGESTTGDLKIKTTAVQKLSPVDIIKNINDFKMRYKSTEKLKSIIGCNDAIMCTKLPLQHNNNNLSSTYIRSKSTDNMLCKNQNNKTELSNRSLSLFPNVNTSVNNVSYVNKLNSISNSSNSDTSFTCNGSDKKKFHFKSFKTAQIGKVINNENENINLIISNDNNTVKNNVQISPLTCNDMENTVILQNIFEGVDPDLLFEDF